MTRPAHKIAAVVLAAFSFSVSAQVITPAPTQSSTAQTNTNQASTISEAQKTALNTEAKQNTGKYCVDSAKSMHWAQKALATGSSSAGGTVGTVIPMPAPATSSAVPAPLHVDEQFLTALEKLTSDYSTVVKLGHGSSGKWALVRDRDNLTNIYFAVSQNSGQMVVKFCELQ